MTEGAASLEADRDSLAGLAGLRILVPSISWPLETFLDGLFRRLIAAGAEITLASSAAVTPPYHHLPTAGDPARPAELAGGVARAWLGLARRDGVGRAARELVPFVRRTPGFRPLELAPFANRTWDVVYVPWVARAVDYLAILDQLGPLVVSCRGSQVSVAPLNPERPELSAGLARVFDLAAGVHCVSEATLADAVAVGLDPARATVVPPGVDTDLFAPPPHPRPTRPPDEPFRLITVGGLGWVKGLEFLLVALRDLVASGRLVHLDVVGAGSDLARLRCAIVDLGLEAVVTLAGSCPPPALVDRLWRADAFVLPSLSEGISNAVLEAMATGLAVVTTDCGGMAEAVRDGVEGLVVPVRSPEALAGAISRLIDDPALAAGLGVAGRQRVLDRFSAAANTAGMAGLLVRAAGRVTA